MTELQAKDLVPMYAWCSLILYNLDLKTRKKIQKIQKAKKTIEAKARLQELKREVREENEKYLASLRGKTFAFFATEDIHIIPAKVKHPRNFSKRLDIELQLSWCMYCGEKRLTKNFESLQSGYVCREKNTKCQHQLRTERKGYVEALNSKSPE